MKNISYGSHAKQQLDIYAPELEGNYPVVVFIHGGGWRSGTKDIYKHLGEWLALNNIVGVLVNYRLTPEVVHPEHTKDCATAISWVYNNIHQYGGDKNRLYLTGYSAGGHLAALIACNQEYLANHSLNNSIIKGVVTMSGVYSVNFSLDIVGYGVSFPKETRAEASPINHIHKNLPPWIVMYCESDFFTLDWQAKRFYNALASKKVKSELIIIDSDHELLTENLVNDEKAKDLINFFQKIKHNQ